MSRVFIVIEYHHLLLLFSHLENILYSIFIAVQYTRARTLSAHQLRVKSGWYEWLVAYDHQNDYEFSEKMRNIPCAGLHFNDQLLMPGILQNHRQLIRNLNAKRFVNHNHKSAGLQRTYFILSNNNILHFVVFTQHRLLVKLLLSNNLNSPCILFVMC